MAFVNVCVVEKMEENTKNFGSKKEFAATNNLFEVKTIATVSADEGENVEPEALTTLKPPSVLSVCDGNWLAVVVGGVINILSVEYETVLEYTHSLPGNATVLAINWMGESGCLAILSSSGELTILWAKFSAVLFSVNLVNESSQPIENGSLNSKLVSGNCVLVCLYGSSTATMFSFPNWNELSNAKVEEVKEVVAKCFSSPVVSTSSALSSFHDVIVLPDALQMVGLNDVNDNMFVSNLENVDFSHLGCPETKFVRVQSTCNGRFVVGVTTDNELVIRDIWSFSIVTKRKLFTDETMRVVDFVLMDEPEMELVHNHIGLVVEKAESVYEVQVRNMESLEVIYAVAVRNGTILLPVSNESDRVMLFIEPLTASKNNWLTDSVYIREISETKPESRLTRLISKNQLDEAETFAKQFGLDVQQVHIARMDYLLSESYADPSPAVFEKLLNSMSAVADHNLVGETCYSGAASFKQYDRIISLLALANKRAISDPVTINRLSRLSYVFATYRLVTGPEDACFEGEQWESFVDGIEGSGQWYLLFNQYVQNAQIKEARLLWHRHGNFIREELLFCCEDPEEPFPQLRDLLEKMTKTVNDHVEVWKDVIEFLEFDIIPTCFSATITSMFPLLVSLLSSLAHLLEISIPAEFPDNALYVTATYERIIKQMTNDAITPTKQAELACIGESASCADEIVKMTANLRVIKRLLTVYQCPLSYHTYVSLTPETICYRILSKAIENPNLVSVNVAKLARPYMDEYRLNPDQTLYRYVEDVCKHSKGVVSSSNPWDEQCLLVCATIDNYPLKCRATILVARGAHPPWSKKLTDAVQAVLNNPATDPEVVCDLRRTCQSAELGLMLLSYGVQIAMLNSVVHTERQFVHFIRFMLQQRETHPNDMQRLTDALKCLDIFRSLNTRSNGVLCVRLIVAEFGKYLQNSQEEHEKDAVVRFIASLDEDAYGIGRKEIAGEIVDNLLAHVDLPVTFADKAYISLRVNRICTVESLIQRFLTEDDQYMEAYEQIGAVRKLQEKYGMWITRTELRNAESRKILLMQYVRKEERSLTEIYIFAACLSLSHDAACQIVLKMSMNDRNVPAILAIMREALLFLPKVSASLVEVCVSACAFVLNSLVNLCPEGATVDVIDTVIDHMTNLRVVLSDLLPSVEDSLPLLEQLLRMSVFTELFNDAIEQCLIEESDQAGEGSKQAANGPSGGIYGISRRVGVYRMCDDGPLIARLEVVPLICAIAPAVATHTDNMTAAVRTSFENEQYNKWNELFDFLSLQNQDLLSHFYRVFFSYLDCGRETRVQLSSCLQNACRNVCERAIQMHPCDLWTPSVLISALAPQESLMLMTDLRRWVSTRKAPQTMINFLRVAQFVAIHNETRDVYKSLSDSFIKSLWSKRLGKAGVSPQLTKQPIERAMQEFAKKRLEAAIVAQFVDQFCGSSLRSREMVNYAVVLLLKASEETDCDKCDAVLNCAAEALELSEEGNSVLFERFRNVLYIISPYNYEVIHFIVSCLCKWLPPNSEEDCAEFVGGCQRILERLIDSQRENAACKQEIGWYMKHCKLLAKIRKDLEMGSKWDKSHNSAESQMRVCYEEGLNGSSFDSSILSNQEEGSALQYEREDVMVSSLPLQAEKRLPFHVFLWRSQSEIDTYLIPVVETENNISTVLVWQTSVRHVTWLHASRAFPRSLLLSSAIIKKCKEVSDKGEDLSSSELRAIRGLLLNSRRDAVVSCIALCFKKMQLSPTKISILQMGVDVAKSWLDQAEDIQPPLTPDEKSGIEEHVRRLDETILKYRTELLLKQAGLYDSKTADLVETPFELISHLYTHAINWNDTSDIATKTELINSLSAINSSISLLSLQTELVLSWLPEDAQLNVDTYAVDLNDTMGGAPCALSGEGGVASDENEVYLLPFFDATITRIVHLLRLIRASDASRLQTLKLQLISNYVKKAKDSSSVPGGFKTIIRAICVLIRAFENEELTSVKSSHEKLFSEIECVQYGRLLELAREDISIEQYKKMQKTTLAKSLLHPSKRHSPQLFHLTSCLVIDHQIMDRGMVDTLLNKLYAARKRQMFAALLKYCRNESSLHGVKNLALFWARAFDQSVAEIVGSSAQSCEQFRSWLYFCLSCPVVGGRPFEGIQSSLKAQGCPLAAQLVQTVTNYTQRTKNVCPGSNGNELTFGWCEQRTTVDETSVEDDTMTF